MRRIDNIKNGSPGTAPLGNNIPGYAVDIPEIVGQTLVRRTWKPGKEKLEFSGLWAIEIISPNSDPVINVYVEDPNTAEQHHLWDVRPASF